MSDDARQLEMIRQVADATATAGIDVWLRGGWAVDFHLGRVTREHEDIDLFVWARDAEALVALLAARSYEEVGGPPPERQRNLRRDGVDLHVTLLVRTSAGGVRTAFAPPEWDDWPDGMLDAGTGRIGETTVRVISRDAQVEIKRRFHEFRPDRPQRDKDRADLRLLEAEI
jgi:hypothetical protein